MNRMVRAITAIIFIAVIAFSAISILRVLTKSLRYDITDQKLYTLSHGTKDILGGLAQPIKLRLYYTKTAALKGPDQIRYFNNYYYFVHALLEEYVKASKGKVRLEVIDPRPYSDDETDAIRYGIRRFAITDEENFFFGLVVQTPFGIEKTIDFFPPERQNFVEYDISYLIENALTRQKKSIGVLSSLPVMGDDVTGYMAQLMRMQGQQPKPAWGIIRHLKQVYEVKSVLPDVEEITDVDILLVIHPKDLPEKTLFAIDQFIVRGGRAVICVDPHCVADAPDPANFGQQQKTNSNLPQLLKSWGLEMPENTFAGDRALAVTAALRQDQRPEKIIGILGLTGGCFNKTVPITANLNRVNVMFPGVLREIGDAGASSGEKPQIEHSALITTTDKGNSWTVSSPYELMAPSYSALLAKFLDGKQSVVMGYLVQGRFESCFPDGIDIKDESKDDKADDSAKDNDPNQTPKTRHLAGLKKAETDCTVAVFADVDFISDIVAYRQTFFGTTVVDDNSALLVNSIENLTGSGSLISIRSRGNFKRPFDVVDQIEARAEVGTAEETARINAEIASFQQELNQILSTAQQGQGKIIESTILERKKEVELKIHELEGRKLQIERQRFQQIDKLGARVRNFCTLPGPAVTLILALILAVRRTLMRRHYISHASDS